MPNIDQTNRDLPPAQGLYHPRNEHDACGLNFVCDVHGRKSHEIVAKAIGALCNLEHRGARGADINTGDGAGILIQVPDRFFRDVMPFDLPEPQLALCLLTFCAGLLTVWTTQKIAGRRGD